MPKGTVDRTKKTRFDLKTLPGAYVELRKLTYGEQLKVRGISAIMRTKREEIERRRAEGDSEANIEMALDLEAVEAYRFKKCIISHNIDDGSTRLNFNNRAHFNDLEPEIGEEIEGYLDEMNPQENLKDKAEDGGTSDDGAGPLVTESSAPSKEA